MTVWLLSTLGLMLLFESPIQAQEAALPARVEQVSLKQQDWAAGLDWIHEFEYPRIRLTSQGKPCTAYTIEMIIDHVRRLRERGLPYVRPTSSSDEQWIIGMSAGWTGEAEFPPQPLFGYQITNPEATGQKLRIILNGGNHPNEHPACWVLHALIDFLVSDEPQARTLRDHVVFFVYPCVNPDGRLYIQSPAHQKLSTGRSSPELVAAGEKNHNRVWDQNGQFRSIDTMKAAMLRDTGGRPDYLLDFHGIPLTSFVFVSDESPLSRALIMTDPGINLRLTPPDPRMLRAVALNADWLGARYTLTPELASQDKQDLFLQGRYFAESLFHVVTGNVPEELVRQHPELEPVCPPSPTVAWLFDGDLTAASAESGNGASTGTEWSPDCPFEYEGNQSLRLTQSESRVDFGTANYEGSRREITLALWVKGRARPKGVAYLIGRYEPAENQRSWALFQRAGSSDFQATFSADGSLQSSQAKQMISSLWPIEEVFDGNWRHIACTFAGGDVSRLRLYVDGSELPVGRGGHFFHDAPIAEFFAAAVPLTVGALPGRKNSFIGEIDEVAIWDQALTAEEIRWLSRNSLHNHVSGTESGPEK